MNSRFVQIFFSEYMIFIDVLTLLGVYFFIRLSQDQRGQLYFWLPFLILIFTFLYENASAYTLYDFEFNKAVNAYFGNTEFPMFNLWLNNVAHLQIITILYFFLIKSWLAPSKKKYMNWMLIGFVVSSQFIQFSGIEPIQWFQPIIFSIGANMILVGSGLYFIGFMANDLYLNSNPLKLVSFWQMTFILFTYSLTYIHYVAMPFLVTYNYELGRSISEINHVMNVLNLAILVLTIAAPMLPRLFEREPAYGYC
ncbi:histidine kinase [Algoriphagus halophytocola]|uniref:Histidine kinase n=1 Tax=Algoriphagus halophytocola TaxID=2991499 RepID=A0ABY6ME92_9BACT|nr:MULTISPECIES: histidine kinase [unclassified Algoriphagus]UZD21254.1 histidine kinase [Algoriphagus sp. TR-M5]WBL42465.1 histidine kinase [Algoriphagus sp. TR-M9]